MFPVFFRRVALSSAALRRFAATRATPLFPYGEKDFKLIREEQQFFVDNTRFIPLLEQNGKKFFVVRPPRFGKTLFLDMLANYYDAGQTKDQFNKLFGGLDVHKQVTEFARSYHVLHLDFSIDIDGDVRQLFTNAVNRHLLSFRKRYNLNFDINEADCFVSLGLASDAVASKGERLYVLVDEYDRFANKLLVERRDQYDAIVRGQSGVRGSSPIRSFLETLKSLRGLEVRSFITGIMPLALADSSGYNIATDITHDKMFASLTGFRKRDLERALELIPHLSADQRRGALDLMRRHYNGYLFFGSEEPLYNSTLSLFLLSRLANRTRDVDELLALDSIRSPVLLDRMTDDNVKLSNSFVNLARSVPAGERAVAALLGESAPLEGGGIVSKFTLNELMSTSADESRKEAQALLFYQGLATYSDTTFTALKLPNAIVRQTMFAQLVTSLKFRDIDKLLRSPSAARLQELLQEIANIKDERAIVNEASFELRVAGALAYLGHKDDIKVQVETVKRLRIDVVLVRGDKALLIECKRVPSDSLVGCDGANLARMSEEALVQLRTRAQSRHMPVGGESSTDRKVQHIVEAAQAQVVEQMRKVREKNTVGITSTTEIHCFAAVLVGTRIVVRQAGRVE
jgi:hypothetical protein